MRDERRGTVGRDVRLSSTQGDALHPGTASPNPTRGDQPVARAVRSFAADRRSAQARRFYEAVARIAEDHVQDGVEREPTVAAALQDLMTGGFAAFRGTTMAELVAHIHATVDRALRDPDPAPGPTPPPLLAELDLALHAALPEHRRAARVVPLRIVRGAMTDAPALPDARANITKVTRPG